MTTRSELKKELKKIGIPVVGNYVKISDLKKVIKAWSDYDEQLLAGYLEAILFTETDDKDLPLDKSLSKSHTR